MSEQAQATAATANTAKASLRTRTRPSRAKSARTNGARHANGTAAKSAAQAAEQEQIGRSAAQESLQDAADQQAGSAGQGTQAGDEQPAALTEEQQQRLVEQVRNALQAYRGFMAAGTGGLDRVLEAVGDICAMLSWQPGQYAGIEAHIQKASQGLATFHANLVSAASLGVEPYLSLPDADLGSWHVAAVQTLKEYRRRIDGKIALMETDAGNTTAILAIERTIHEQRMVAGIAGAALGRLLAQGGHAR